MRMRAATMRLGKLAILLTLFSLGLALDNCSSTNGGDTQQQPVIYNFGGPYW